MEDNKIIEAINLLKNSGYAVIKITSRMNKDMNNCAEMEERRECKDCDGCSCNICLLEN